MYKTSFADKTELDDILRFLEERGWVDNVWLASEVVEAFGPEAGFYKALVCWRGNDITGVAAIRLRKKDTFAYGYRVHLDAVDEDALRTLMDALPEGEPKTFFIFNRQVQNYIATLSNISGSYCDLYYTVDSSSFRPAGADNVVELTSANASLLQGVDDEPDWDHMGDRKLYAVVRDNKAVSRVCTVPLGPAMPSGKQVISISDLFTEEQYRRQGLAKSLVSYVTDLILKDNNVPLYWTDPDNIASQKLVLGLGYRQLAQLAVYM
jgi:GNAT superfamily N-acetyltransferase